MLLKSRISNIDAHDIERWRQTRLSRITSSNAWKICQEEGLGKEGMKYIRSRVFESISGVPSESEFTNEYTAAGLINEGVALRKYAAKVGAEFVISQKIIYGETDMFSSTPDGLWIKIESTDGLSYNGEVWQVKCYAADHHMECLMAETPEDLRRIDRKTYFQVLDEMLNVDFLIGKAIFFNPNLPDDKGGLHVIHFNKAYQDPENKVYPIKNDLKFLRERKNMAVAEFHRIKNKICGL